LKSELKN